jgi:molybdopterin synthase sulfur carrier subunit
MATVWIPAQLRSLTGGRERAQVSGGSLRQVIEALEAAYPGIQARLLEGDAIRSGIVALVDGETRAQSLSQPVAEGGEVAFIHAISGGES